MHLGLLAFLVIYFIGHVWHCGDYLHIELAAQTLLHNLHVKQAQESATETEAQSHRRFWRECESGIIQLEFFKRRTEILEIFGVDWINAGKHHWLHLLETGNRLLTWACSVCDGITHSHLCGVFNTTDNITHIASAHLILWLKIQLENTQFVNVVFTAGVHEFHEVAFMDCTVNHLEIHDNATEWIEYRVEDKRLKRSLRVALRSRYALHDGLQNLRDSLAGFSTCPDDVFGGAAKQFHNLIFHLVGVCAFHIYLVDNWNNFQIIVQGQVKVGNGLSLHALSGIHNQQTALARSNGARHFVREIDVSWSVDKIERIIFAILNVIHLNGVALDGNATLSLQVHVIEHLILHFLAADGLGVFQQSVRQGAFTMVDMRYNAKISNILHLQFYFNYKITKKITPFQSPKSINF